MTFFSYASLFDLGIQLVEMLVMAWLRLWLYALPLLGRVTKAIVLLPVWYVRTLALYLGWPEAWTPTTEALGLSVVATVLLFRILHQRQALASRRLPAARLPSSRGSFSSSSFSALQ
jgi:hypothetical protein